MSLYGYLGRDLSTSGETVGAAMAEGAARRAQRDVDESAMRLDRAVLALEAVWTLVREKLNLTEEELAQRMNDLDLSDGRLDGKVNKGAVTCPGCSRTISRRLPKCIYCGQAIVHDPFV